VIEAIRSGFTNMTQTVPGERGHIIAQAAGSAEVMEDSGQPAAADGRLLGEYMALMHENPDAYHGLMVMAAVGKLSAALGHAPNLPRD
jgi:hypothetical protein